MNTKKYHLENFGKFLLNRVTNCSQVLDYIEKCLATEDEAALHTFHKIIVHNWKGSDKELFYSLGNYYTVPFIPVSLSTRGDAATFYTSNLSLVLKIAKLDFMFPHHRVMYSLDVVFNDKTSADLFENRLTLNDIVMGVVSSRFNEKCELNLSAFHNDPEFIAKKILFYRVSLLCQYKILMLRIGKDTKALNLSNNNLSHIPMEIMNFFIKGDLKSVNLSHNIITSIADLQRLSSKIEKLWVEGNPFCDDIEPISYVKAIVSKFPRLSELDGLKLSDHGIMLPFFKNFSESTTANTKMVVETFLTLYFTHYDTVPRRLIDKFYDNKAKLSLSTSFSAADDARLPHYAMYSRNILDVIKRSFAESNNTGTFVGRDELVDVLVQLPETVHDPTTFNVDVLKHDKNYLMIVVDGNYKEKVYNSSHQYFRFRRTFIFKIQTRNNQREYSITNEMFTVSLATPEQLKHSFLMDEERGTNPMALKQPEKTDIEALCNIFCHLTQLKREEALLRLKIYCWDLTKALQEFMLDMKMNKISSDSFQDEEVELSDGSSILDEIDY